MMDGDGEAEVEGIGSGDTGGKVRPQSPREVGRGRAAITGTNSRPCRPSETGSLCWIWFLGRCR